MIQVNLFGTRGGASLRNVGGSFYDFETRQHCGTASECLIAPHDEWGGRAAAAWARRLAYDPSFDQEALRIPQVAAAIDRIYSAACAGWRH